MGSARVGSAEVNTKSKLDTIPLWIDNEPVYTGTTFDITDPKSHQVIWKASGAEIASAQKAVDSSAKAFPAWSTAHPKERRRIFLKVAELIRSRKDEIIQTIVEETSSSVEWAAGINVHLGAEIFEELASIATTCQTGWLPTTEDKGIELCLIVCLSPPS